MKFAIIVAVAICAVSCQQVPSVNPTQPVYMSPEIQTIARNLNFGIMQIKKALMNHMSMISNRATLKQAFFNSYDNLLNVASSVRSDCVTDGMRDLSNNAVSAFSACLPDQATITARMQQCQDALNKVFDRLNEVDQKLINVDVVDAVHRAEIVAQADVEIAGGFFLDVTSQIFKAAGQACPCMERVAATLRSTALDNINNVSKCYSAPH